MNQKLYKHKIIFQSMPSMVVELTQKPKKPIVIEGFPGYGLVGTIATDFLIKHLNAKPIGSIKSAELVPMVALHEGRVVNPIGIFYSEKENIVIFHALSFVNGLEWEIAQVVAKICKDLDAKELISLEGVASQNAALGAYYYSSKNSDKFEKIKVKQLKEGIVMGVTGALLLESKGIPMSCVFVESHSSYADGEAAAKIIEVLDKYLGLKVDYKPLLEAAKKFEEKLKILMEKAQKSVGEKQKKELSYLG